MSGTELHVDINFSDNPGRSRMVGSYISCKLLEMLIYFFIMVSCNNRNCHRECSSNNRSMYNYEVS